MALLDSEIAQIKYHLGFNVLTIGSLPYIGHTSLFEQVIGVYTDSGAATTSATAVTAADTATPVTLTLASGTGFEAGARVVVDVDDRQEVVTAQNVSGTSLTLLLRLAHSGTYPVLVEGGETIIRTILRQLHNVSTQIGDAYVTAGLKRIDDIEFYGNGATVQAKELNSLRMHWRDELASALGVPNFWRMKSGGGGASALY